MEVALFLVVVATVIAGMIAAAVWILRPLDRAADPAARSLQFMVADFLALVFLLQLPLALFHAPFSPWTPPTVWLMDLLGCGSIAILWLKSVGILTRSDVRRAWHRVVFLVAILPVAYIGTAALAVLALLLIDTAFFRAGLRTVEESIGLGAAFCGLGGAILLAARFTRYMVAAAGEDAAAQAAPPRSIAE